MKQHKWNEYKQTLIIELSFSNVENNHLFWNNLNQIPNNLQCKYLSKITKLLSHQSQHYDKEVLKNFIKNEIIDYVMKYTSITSITTTTTTPPQPQPPQSTSKVSGNVLENIVLLLSVLIDKFEKYLQEDTTNSFQNFIVKLLSSSNLLSSLVNDDGYLTNYLLNKSKIILSKNQYDQIVNVNIMVRTERERERQASIVALNNNNIIDIRSGNTMQQQQQNVNVASLKWLI